MEGDDLDGKLERLRARVEQDAAASGELNEQVAETRAAAAMPALADARVEAAIAKRQPGRQQPAHTPAPRAR